MGKLIKSNASLTADMEEIHNKSIHFQANGNQIFKIATKSWYYSATWQEYYMIISILGCSNTSTSQSGLCLIRVQTGNNSDITTNYSINFLTPFHGLSLKNFYIEYKNSTVEGEQTTINVYVISNSNSRFQINVISNTGWDILSTPEVVATLPTEGWTGKYATMQTDTYSTNYSNYIGKYTNDKPIYRATFEGTIGTTTTTKIGTIYNPEDIISVTGSIKYANGWHQLGSYANNNYYSLVQIMKDGSVQVWTKENSGYSGLKVIVVVEYTKTTDTV